MKSIEMHLESPRARKAKPILSKKAQAMHMIGCLKCVSDGPLCRRISRQPQIITVSAVSAKVQVQFAAHKFKFQIWNVTVSQLRQAIKQQILRSPIQIPQIFFSTPNGKEKYLKAFLFRSLVSLAKDLQDLFRVEHGQPGFVSLRRCQNKF